MPDEVRVSYFLTLCVDIQCFTVKPMLELPPKFQNKPVCEQIVRYHHHHHHHHVHHQRAAFLKITHLNTFWSLIFCPTDREKKEPRHGSKAKLIFLILLVRVTLCTIHEHESLTRINIIFLEYSIKTQWLSSISGDFEHNDVNISWENKPVMLCSTPAPDVFSC